MSKPKMAVIAQGAMGAGVGARLALAAAVETGLAAIGRAVVAVPGAGVGARLALAAAVGPRAAPATASCPGPFGLRAAGAGRATSGAPDA